jgi:hypothetical protein
VYGRLEASLTLTLFSGLRERALVGLAGALTGDRTPPPPPRAAGRVVSGGVALYIEHPISQISFFRANNKKKKKATHLLGKIGKCSTCYTERRKGERNYSKSLS